MPALSPTMEIGSIAKWNLKEGEAFETGASLCDVETDKATVSFDATDEGYIAKILVTSGEIKVGQPLLVTVEEADQVSAFSNFSLANISDSGSSSSATTTGSAPQTAPPAQLPVGSVNVVHSTAGDRVFASPLAKKLLRDANARDALSGLQGVASGPNNRVLAKDVKAYLSNPNIASVKHSGAQVSIAAVSSVTPTSTAQVAAHTPKATVAHTSSTSVYEDFQLAEDALLLAQRYSHAKSVIPHYYLSVELNLTNLLKLRDTFNSQFQIKSKKGDKVEGLAVLDLMVKAAALSMKQVPDVNSSWMDNFVRRYHQVDINLVVGSGNALKAPIIRDVANKGFGTLSKEIAAFHSADNASNLEESVGTFTIHNLGMYGIKAAAPIVLPPQSCALSLGTIVDTVIPASSDCGKEWEVAPVMVATMSCDHRVVDGAVAAQWLSAFKHLVENPVDMML